MWGKWGNRIERSPTIILSPPDTIRIIAIAAGPKYGVAVTTKGLYL